MPQINIQRLQLTNGTSASLDMVEGRIYRITLRDARTNRTGGQDYQNLDAAVEAFAIHARNLINVQNSQIAIGDVDLDQHDQALNTIFDEEQDREAELDALVDDLKQELA